MMRNNHSITHMNNLTTKSIRRRPTFMNMVRSVLKRAKAYMKPITNRVTRATRRKPKSKKNNSKPPPHQSHLNDSKSQFPPQSNDAYRGTLVNDSLWLYNGKARKYVRLPPRPNAGYSRRPRALTPSDLKPVKSSTRVNFGKLLPPSSNQGNGRAYKSIFGDSDKFKFVNSSARPKCSWRRVKDPVTGLYRLPNNSNYNC